MTFTKRASAATVAALAALCLASPAFAFCGVIEQSASSHQVNKATARANHLVDKQVKSLKRQYRKKLVLSERQMACIGGALAIDANGNEIEGPSRCTVTQPFCVNP